MTGIEERVKEFLESWKMLNDPRCTECGAVVTDGNFAMIDGKLICLNCHNSNLKTDTENGHGHG